MRWIGDRQQYVSRTGAGFDTAIARGDTLAIEVRFVDRVVREGLAYECGQYCVTITDPHGAQQRFYGRFDSILRHAPEGWKLLLDQDDERIAGEADFAGARPLDDTAAFPPT